MCTTKNVCIIIIIIHTRQMQDIVWGEPELTVSVCDMQCMTLVYMDEHVSSNGTYMYTEVYTEVYTLGKSFDLKLVNFCL